MIKKTNKLFLAQEQERERGKEKIKAKGRSHGIHRKNWGEHIWTWHRGHGCSAPKRGCSLVFKGRGESKPR